MTLAQDPTTRSAPDRHEVFGAHEGGKLATGLTAPLADERDLSIATPPVSPTSAAPSPTTPRSPPVTPGRTGWSPSSATAPRCSASATSGRARRCR
jgi:hypothetical protein